MNPWRIALVLGWILLFLAGMQLLPLGVALLHREGDAGLLALSALVAALVGGLAVLLSRGRGRGEPTIREGFAVVSFAWVLMALFGALPFGASGHFDSWIDALFESMSGFTTTGASVLASPEDLPAGIGFWRCFIQWIGGLGIVLFGLAILPLLGAGGLHLFKAEAPGPTSEKITPRLKDTAKLLWILYASLTALEALLLWAFGMSFHDAWAHSFTTMATGGFSTRNASIGHFDSTAIHLTVTLFMFLGGVNFVLYFRALTRRDPGEIWRDAEWRSYAGIAAGAALLLGGLLALEQGRLDASDWVAGLFQSVSIMTTTGFTTANYDSWHPLAHVVLLGLMLVGGMAGSTSGGMKVVRIRVLFSHARQSLRKMIQPRAVTVVRVGSKGVAPELVTLILGFSVVFAGLLALGTAIVAASGHDFEVALSASLSCLSNIGPGMGEIGPNGNYGEFHDTAKLLLTALMLLGRLELFTVLVLFSRHFWKK
jgi:trk system potassium uptake protein